MLRKRRGRTFPRRFPTEEKRGHVGGPENPTVSEVGSGSEGGDRISRNSEISGLKPKGPSSGEAKNEYSEKAPGKGEMRPSETPLSDGRLVVLKKLGHNYPRSPNISIALSRIKLQM